MELNKAEMKALELKTSEAERDVVKELDDLQLLMVGGGNHVVIIA